MRPVDKPEADAVTMEQSRVAKRSIIIGSRKSSVSLEDAFWNALNEIASEEGLTASVLVTGIDNDRQHANLSSAIRLYVLDYYRQLASEAASRGNRKRS
jgi:predicted DNA-binding ribbon-helix-helix protein